MRLQKRIGFKGVKIAGVVSAIGFLFFFQNHKKISEHPRVKIGKISARMNFSTIRVQGILEVDARPFRNGSVLYIVNDGTGTLPIFFNEPSPREPSQAGQKISAIGTLSVRADHEIRMQAQQVLIEPEVEDWGDAFKLSEITTEKRGERMTAQGRVSRVWKSPAHSKAPHRIIIKDRSGTLDVVHWLKNPPTVAPGDVLKVTGTVTIYKGTVQLKIRNAEDIQPSSFKSFRPSDR